MVVDGEQVHVPAPGEQLLPNTNGSGGGGAVGQGSGTGPIAAGPVNLNTADLAQLDTLPGVGPVLAQRILHLLLLLFRNPLIHFVIYYLLW